MVEELSLVINNPNEGEFLKRIEWNKEEFESLVTAVAERYAGIVYSEENIKLAKEDRAKLNALKKAINDRRIQVKNEIMAPYTEFEKEVKEIIAKIEEPINNIGTIINEFEENAKLEKKHALNEYFREQLPEELTGMITFEMIFDTRCLNASVSMKKAKEDIDSKIEIINRDLDTIANMDPEFSAYGKDIYVRTLDLSKAVAEITRMQAVRRAEEEKKRREEEEEARIEAERLRREEEKSKMKTEIPEPEVPVTENEVEESENKSEEDETETHGNETETHGNETINPFSEQKKVYRASFTVEGTREQIMALKQYMIDNHIKFMK